jgi:hypothetical protein
VSRGWLACLDDLRDAVRATWQPPRRVPGAGRGPPDILFLDQWFSHMDAQWDLPPLAAFRERLASFGRLILYDKRRLGTLN